MAGDISVSLPVRPLRYTEAKYTEANNTEANTSEANISKINSPKANISKINSPKANIPETNIWIGDVRPKDVNQDIRKVALVQGLTI